MVLVSDWKMFVISSAVILSLSGLLFLFKMPDPGNNYSGYQIEKFNLPYNIAKPDTFFIMPKKLKEISGIKTYGDNHLFAVNDEKGVLYKYDFSERTIISEIDFGKKGDYEAVTRNKDLVYIAESNGNIKVVDVGTSEKVEEYDTPLSKRNNVEGMCFDAKNNQLIIACKGEMEKKKSRNKKGIYTFDLSDNHFDKDPFKVIELKAEKKSLIPINISNDLLSNLNVNSRLNSFSPSGLDIDPITSNIYIISSRGRLLAVMDSEKNMVGIYFLQKRLFGQPEGICFDEKGNIY